MTHVHAAITCWELDNHFGLYIPRNDMLDSLPIMPIVIPGGARSLGVLYDSKGRKSKTVSGVIQASLIHQLFTAASAEEKEPLRRQHVIARVSFNWHRGCRHAAVEEVIGDHQSSFEQFCRELHDTTVKNFKALLKEYPRKILVSNIKFVTNVYDR